jgi:hypothetical protein
MTTLLQGIQADLVQLDALAAYQQDVGTLTQAQAGAASTASGVAQAVAAERAAEVELTSAAQAVDSQVKRLSGLAVALYIHEDLGTRSPAPDLAAGVASRQFLIDLLLDQRKRQVAAARKDLSAVNDSVKQRPPRSRMLRPSR